jgi:hypothetical protein
MEQIGLAVLVLVVAVLFFLAFRVKAGKAGKLRPLLGLEELPGSVGHSAETGQPIHVSVGVAGVAGSATAETWAGLAILDGLATEAAACDTSLIVTVADPTVLPVAQDILRRAYLRSGNPDGYRPDQVRFVAPLPLAYAAGVAGILEREPLIANIMVGSFADEYLLMGEAGARRGLHQIAGAADPRALPFVYATADEAIIGEEMFAGSAYLTRGPIQVASLLVEDWGRWAILLVVVGLALFRALF